MKANAKVDAEPAVCRPGTKKALGLLLQAHTYAKGLERSDWDFAVEIRALEAAGLTVSDLRWLVCMGHAEHGIEVTLLGEQTREFRRVGNFRFTKRTCFVLTEGGVEFAQSVCDAVVLDNKDGAAKPLARAVEPEPEPIIPRWDGDRHQLFVDKTLVKEFKLPSPNQEIILTAFQEDGWPPRIDDPLPPVAELDPKRRLHDTIKGLNRNQKQPLLRFMGDGTGQGVRWELAASGDGKAP